MLWGCPHPERNDGESQWAGGTNPVSGQQTDSRRRENGGDGKAERQPKGSERKTVCACSSECQ